ncbi:DUF969 domain-containing protein [Burkholderiaceae bacterium DAT-1]|nr:DUF969 domain-containing protein [Burkholderiaceae bacterium DAT-1]
MEVAVNLWPLIGIVLIVIGFILRFNPLLVVVTAGVAAGLASGLPFTGILEALGKGFTKTQNLTLILLLPLAVTGLMERYGLRDQARNWISKIAGATAGRLLVVYLAFREITAALGLTGVAGHAQTIRPVVVPMIEGATERAHGELDDATRTHLRAMSAATDNVGLFFGEDVFVAFGAVILMHTFLKESGIPTNPMDIAFWGLPTACFAFLLHAVRLLRMDRTLARMQGGKGGQP